MLSLEQARWAQPTRAHSGGAREVIGVEQPANRPVLAFLADGGRVCGLVGAQPHDRASGKCAVLERRAMSDDTGTEEAAPQRNYLEPAEHAPLSDHTLHDVVNGSMAEDLPGDIREWPSLEFAGFHIGPTSDGEFVVQPDGYAGDVGWIDPDDFDDVLALATRLHRLSGEFWHEYTDDERRGRAGDLMTSDPSKQDEDGWLYVPRDGPAQGSPEGS